MYNSKSRKISRIHKTIRKLLSIRLISIDYVKSKDNIADPLTKRLNRELVEKSLSGMGLKSMNRKLVQRKPNLVDWRSQDLSSKGKSNCKGLVRSLLGLFSYPFLW